MTRRHSPLYWHTLVIAALAWLLLCGLPVTLLAVAR